MRHRPNTGFAGGSRRTCLVARRISGGSVRSPVCARWAGLEPTWDKGGPGTHALGPRRWPDHHGGSHNHGDRPHLDYHRASTRRTRSGRLPGGTRGGGVKYPALVGRRWRAQGSTRSSSFSAMSDLWSPASTGSNPGRARRFRVLSGPPSGRPDDRLPGPWWCRRCGCRRGRIR